MKRITFTIITLILITFIFSCENVNRNRYTGMWDFVVVYGYGSWGDWKSDTLYYSGRITTTFAYNILNIEYLNDKAITMELNACGELIKDFDNSHEYGYGEFLGEKKVKIKTGMNALGGGYSYTIDGTKKQ